MSSIDVEFIGSSDNNLVGDIWRASGSEERGQILMLHGGGQTRHSWDTSAASLSASGWDVTTVDARGHGDSEWPPNGDYSLDAFAADLSSLIAEFKAPPIVIGASLGGMSAMAAIGELGAHARALILVDIAPRSNPVGAQRILRFMRGHSLGFDKLEDVAVAVEQYNPRSRTRNLDGLRKNVRQHENGRWYWHWDPRFLDFGDEPTRATRIDRLERAASNVTIPILLVRGSNSDVVSPADAAHLQELAPQAEIVEVGAGHMVVGDDNDVFTQQVIPFLDDVSAGTAIRRETA